jgi:transposase-like protein/ribosomal protein S27AE
MSCIASAVVLDDRINQRSLDDFFSEIKSSSEQGVGPRLGFQQVSETGLWLLPLKIEIENVVVLQNSHCPICGHALIKNGRNRKMDYIPEEQCSNEYWLQRYLCPKCGEIRIDFHAIFAGNGKYGDQTPKIVRLLYFLSIVPTLIQKVLIPLRSIVIPLSTIKSWIYPLKTELLPVLYPPKMPSCGSLVYDEIHLKIEGDKEYLLVALDSYLHLVLRHEVHWTLERNDVKGFFRNMQKEQNIIVNSVVHDDAKATESAFGDRSLKNIDQELCHTHFKWNIREKVYEAAGLGKQFKKPLPRGHFRFLRTCYWLIEAKDEFRFIIRIEMAHSLADTLENPMLHKIVDHIAANQKLLQQHIYSPYLEKTTALIESINHEIETNRIFKHGEQTEIGSDFTAGTRVYMHNMRALYQVPPKLAKEQQYLDFLQDQYGLCEEIRSQKCKFGHLKAKILHYQQSLEVFWKMHFPEGTLILFKKLWGVDH